MNDAVAGSRRPIVLGPGAGRAYPMGRISGGSSRTLRARAHNLSIPGPFEPHMPSIVQWFNEHPPQNAGA